MSSRASPCPKLTWECFKPSVVYCLTVCCDHISPPSSMIPSLKSAIISLSRSFLTLVSMFSMARVICYHLHSDWHHSVKRINISLLNFCWSCEDNSNYYIKCFPFSLTERIMWNIRQCLRTYYFMSSSSVSPNPLMFFSLSAIMAQCTSLKKSPFFTHLIPHTPTMLIFNILIYSLLDIFKLDTSMWRSYIPCPYY